MYEMLLVPPIIMKNCKRYDCPVLNYNPKIEYYIATKISELELEVLEWMTLIDQ